MQADSFIIRLFGSILALCLLSAAEAGSPVWTFAPLTSTTISVSTTSMATIQYQVTNQSRKTHVLEMRGIQGVSQDTSSGHCANPFTLGYQQSCTLTLAVHGAALQGSVVGGPVVCQQGNALQCYQPNSADALNISLTTAPGDTTLSASVSTLGLSVNNTGLNAALTGNQRLITITNTGSNPAINVTYSPSPALPIGTTISPLTCGTIAASSTCVLTIIPGSTPSATPGDTNPIPITLSISGTNTNTLTPTLNILTYGSVYQGGYVYAVNDSTPDTGSIGGKVAALTDNVAGPTSFVNATPNWGGFGCDIGTSLWDDATQGANDGSTNSAAIVSALTTNYSTSPCSLGSPVALTDYAAGRCSQYTTTSDAGLIWYLPSMCELSGASPRGNCTPGTTSMLNQLWLLSPAVGGFVDTGFYWSSTEVAGPFFAPDYAWYQRFSAGGDQFGVSKDYLLGVRCSRALTI